ncbi:MULTISPECIES: hypothetical protein [unclassified Bradyrhizobium]|uniref:hypothetical protein n=1 Tax=unclassified Bradyrhizobium TaxID=2631580 RepID=UPI00048C611E|nr:MULTISPECIES: hypothetical protein [unclassified Bradyrhizobium]QIG92367.1 hypothetical protein G6P99_07515 [Bradyrhizobium sp. 6(2017)]
MRRAPAQLGLVCEPDDGRVVGPIGRLQLAIGVDRVGHFALPQINQVRRDTLRNDKFNREQQVQVTADPATRQLIQQRLNEIADALDDVNR